MNLVCLDYGATEHPDNSSVVGVARRRSSKVLHQKITDCGIPKLALLGCREPLVHDHCWQKDDPETRLGGGGRRKVGKREAGEGRRGNEEMGEEKREEVVAGGWGW